MKEGRWRNISLLTILAFSAADAKIPLNPFERLEAGVKSATSTWFGETDSPELLGEATTIFFKNDNGLTGVVMNNYAAFLIEGAGENEVKCTMTQISGGEIGDVNGPIPCLIVWQNDGTFRGWIDFRGHTRKFCGAPEGIDYPRICKWR